MPLVLVRVGVGLAVWVSVGEALRVEDAVALAGIGVVVDVTDGGTGVAVRVFVAVFVGVDVAVLVGVALIVLVGA